jgi:hypothetical protein
MKIEVDNSINSENHIIKDDDFFTAFTEPKEEFEQEEPPKEDLFNNKKDFLNTGSEPKLLTKADKNNIADFFVTTITNYIDDLANGYTGFEQKGRYMPSAESITEIKRSVSNLLPDKFRVPEWLKLTILLTFAYQPIVKQVKKDHKTEVKKDE